MSDFARFRESLGIAKPAPNASGQELFDYLSSITLLRDENGSLVQPGLITPDLLGEGSLPGQLEVMRERWGFTIADVDQAITTTRGETSVAILRGDFDSATIAAALESDPVFGGSLEVDEEEGATYFSWAGVPPADPMSDEEFEAARRLGRSIATQPNVLYYSTADYIAELVSAAQGTSLSLADVEVFRLLADGLGRFDLYSAGIGFDTMPLSQAATIECGLNCPLETRAAIEARLQQEGVLLPYEASAAGVGRDTSGYRFVAVAVHQDEGTALANADRLRQRIERGARNSGGGAWREVLRDLQVSAEGRVMFVTARVDDPGLWSGTLIYNFLLVHED